MGKVCAIYIARQLCPPFVSETPAETRGDRIDDDCFVFLIRGMTLFVEHHRPSVSLSILFRPEEDDDDFIQDRPSSTVTSTTAR